MNKSNIPELIIWGFYALVSGACFLMVSVAFSGGMGFGIIQGVVAFVLGTVVILLLSGGIHRMVATPKLRAFFEKKKILLLVLESLIFIGMLVGMVILRSESSWDVAGNEVYKMARVTQEGFYVAEVHGGYKLYLYLMNCAMMLLGNQTFAVIILQLILLVCAAISMHFGVRRLAGPIAALAATAFLGFAPYMYAETCNLTPFLLILFFYGLALNCIGGISYSMTQSNNLIEQIAAVLCYVASGVLVGFCCYLDVSGITLLIILTGVICFGDDIHFQNEEEQTKGDENSAKSRRLRIFEKRFAQILGSPVVVFVCTVLIAVFTFWRMHGTFAALSGQLAIYVPGRFQIPMTVEPAGGYGEGMLIAALLMIGVFSFWFSRSMGNRGRWLFSVVLLAGMQCFGIASPEHFDATALLYLLCVILAGCGLADLWAIKPEKQEEPEEIQMAIIDMDAPEDAGVASEIHFIENPLPLPKKHTKKTMDYDYEVADDDDFDIQ